MWDRWRRLRGNPAAVAVAASFGIAELLTGSTRPVLLVASPVVFVLLVGLYGCGVLSARELTVRWGGGWVSLLLLGAAYGVLEEGLVARSFFDPDWGDLGDLAGHGRWAGVNWVWTVYLTIFHAVFSVAMPTAIARVTTGNDRAWLSSRGRALAAAGLAALTVLGAAAVNPHHGSPVALGATVAVVLVFTGLARLATRFRWRVVAIGPPTVRPRRLAVLGFVGSAVLFALSWVVPSLGPPGALLVALLLAWAMVAAVVARRMARRPLDGPRQLALIAGALGWLALIDLALAPVRPDTAALVVLVLAVFVRRRIARRGTSVADNPVSR